MPKSRPSRTSTARPSARRTTPTRTSSRRVVAFIGAFVAAALVVAALALPAHAVTVARPAQALAGGGPAVPSELNLTNGATMDGLFPLFVRNTSTVPLRAKIVDKSVSGITIAPEVRELTVNPGQTATVPYKLRVDTNLAAGKYPVEVSVLSAEVSVTQGTVQFLPAVTQRYSVVVQGAAGDIKARATDRLEQKPVSGVFIAARIDGVSRTPVARADGKELAARVVPGEYEVSFELDGRPISSKRVLVAQGKTTEADLDVSLLQFTKVDVTRIDTGKQIAAVSVDAQFDNALRPLAGANISLEVRRDGKKIDDFVVQQFQTLAKGSGAVSTRYVPRDGWKSGKYEFRLHLAAESVSIVAATKPTLQVGATATRNRLWLWIGVFTFAVLGALALTAFLVRRGRRGRRSGNGPTGRTGRRAGDRDPLAGRRVQRRGIATPLGARESAADAREVGETL